MREVTFRQTLQLQRSKMMTFNKKNYSRFWWHNKIFPSFGIKKDKFKLGKQNSSKAEIELGSSGDLSAIQVRIPNVTAIHFPVYIPVSMYVDIQLRCNFICIENCVCLKLFNWSIKYLRKIGVCCSVCDSGYIPGRFF